MIIRRFFVVGVLAPLILIGLSPSFAAPQSLQQQNEVLFQQLQKVHGLTDSQINAVRDIFAKSSYIGQGNPAIAHHPVTPAECQAKLSGMGVRYENPRFERICKAKYMAPLYDPRKEKPEDAKACIDQFEFPDIPCTYPVVWVKAREAAEICWAIGKRLCDAHEWEGACAGCLEPPDYRFDLGDVRRMRFAHNQADSNSKSWSYGPEYQNGICATGSRKSPGCDGGGWTRCGSNTYPSGDFPACHSPLEVYDLNGNAAEHMNLPLNKNQMSSRGSTELGYTEMKGSWFVFDTTRAHEDWCRWRAPYWHGSRVMDPRSHSNYHLGFRCCKTLDK